jgi:hypothetical protein
MKKLAVALMLLLFGLIFGFSATPQKEIRRIQVTAQAITSLPSGQPYVLDLSSHTIYELTAGIDLSRLRVRTSQGEVAFSELIRNASGAGRSFLGRAVDMRTEILEPGARKLGSGGDKTAGFVNCAAGKKADCHCAGWRDCIGLAVTKVGCDYWSCTFPEAPAEPAPYCTCSGPAK